MEQPSSDRSGTRGQALVELVLSVPLFLILVFGILEFGNMWRTYQITTNVAREGARVASLPGTDEDDVTSTVQERLHSAGLDSTKVTAVFNDGAGLCDETTVTCEGAREMVRLEYPYTLPVFGQAVNLLCAGCGESYGDVTLVSEATMRHE